jgi:hypothetical protein
LLPTIDTERFLLESSDVDFPRRFFSISSGVNVY